MSERDLERIVKFQKRNLESLSLETSEGFLKEGKIVSAAISKVCLNLFMTKKETSLKGISHAQKT